MGVRPAHDDGPQNVFICEVTTHTGGMLIVRRGKASTESVVREKLERLQEFAAMTFPAEQYRYRYQWWSPVVAVGKLTTYFDELRAEWEQAGCSLEFVINDEYTKRIGELMDSARGNSSTTSEPAYRLLPILTRLRGERPEL